MISFIMHLYFFNCQYFFTDIFSNDLFTTIKTKGDLPVQVEAKSSIDSYH